MRAPRAETACRVDDLWTFRANYRFTHTRLLPSPKYNFQLLCTAVLLATDAAVFRLLRYFDVVKRYFRLGVREFRERHRVPSVLAPPVRKRFARLREFENDGTRNRHPRTRRKRVLDLKKKYLFVLSNVRL